MNSKTKEFKRIQLEWDKKLKASGFIDIERRDERLHDYHSHKFNKPANDTNGRNDVEATSEYYRRATHFLHAHDFKNLDERQIWELHSEGRSIKEFRNKRVRCWQTAYRILNRLIAEMRASWRE